MSHASRATQNLASTADLGGPGKGVPLIVGIRRGRARGRAGCEAPLRSSTEVENKAAAAQRKSTAPTCNLCVHVSREALSPRNGRMDLYWLPYVTP